MRVLYYLIYKLRPFGKEIEQRPSTPEPPPDLDLTATPWSVPNKAITSTPSTTQIIDLTSAQNLESSTQQLATSKEGLTTTSLDVTNLIFPTNYSNGLNITHASTAELSNFSADDINQLNALISNMIDVPGLSNETLNMLKDYIAESSKFTEFYENSKKGIEGSNYNKTI